MQPLHHEDPPRIAVHPTAMPNRRRGPAIVGATLVSAAGMLTFGVWSFAAPRSFADFIDYAPYNEHLLHDVGAFQIGIGVTLVVALFASDALLVALTGFVTASALHTLSHYVDRNIGGHDSDVPTLGLLTLVGLYGIVAIVRRSGS
jgi:hypothetical protein